MYKSLEIENFRGLRHLELPSLAPITILTGRNNTGKTAVLEALFLHASGPRAAQLFLLTLRPSRMASSVFNIELSKTSNPWETAFYGKDLSNVIRFSASVADAGNLAEHIIVELSHLSQSARQQLSTALQTESAANASTSEAGPGSSYAMRIKIHASRISDQSGTYRLWPDFTQTISPQLGQIIAGPGGLQQAGGLTFSLQPEESANALFDAYFLGIQNRAPTELAQRYTNLRLRRLDQLFLNVMRALEPSLESIEILATPLPTLYFTIGGGPPLPITVMGEGMSAVANFAASILETPNGLVLIDEIENGIHYTALEKVWIQIGHAAKAVGTQVVASTHSYECVRAAYGAFKDDPGFLQLIRMESGDDSPAAIEAVDYDLETLKSALDMNLDVR